MRGRRPAEVIIDGPDKSELERIAHSDTEPWFRVRLAKGLHITHWSSDDLARQAVADGIVAGISARTVRSILHDVDLQPHRTRYGKTARLDDQFKKRAEQVLWCDGNATHLAEQGVWVVCVDEVPTF